MNNIKRFLIGCILILLLISSIFLTWLYSQIDSALPILDGKATIFGLNDLVSVERDQQGIPTIKANSREDLALATGFIHAQERFFQMDLLRRNSAGELASLFGNLALDYDKSIRRHRFRERARSIVRQLPAEQMTLLSAYTRGVNAGLYQLKAAPFEYLLLQQAPVEWQEEDTILTVLSMYLDLQYRQGEREQTLGLMKSTLPPEIYQFLNPKGSIWDATIDGTKFEPAPLPKTFLTSVAKQKAVNNIAQQRSNNKPAALTTKDKYQSDLLPGSNNWAVSGNLSATGSAIVANDMHLGIRVPNTWFRASFEYPVKDSNHTVKITGLTLPGTPAMVAGSNGHIAWGFTNSYGDWSDVIILETSADQKQYLTPNGFVDFTEHKQIIAVKDNESVEITFKETIWGPVIGKNENNQQLAYRWVAHDIEAVNFQHVKLERAKSVDEAFKIAATAGIPAQNMMIGDKSGNIGWTIMGPIPQKSATFGDIPTSWADGKNTWLGYLTKAEYPKIKNPSSHRLWTANSRVVGGEMVGKIGNGGYALGARSQQIKQRLFEQEEFNEEALLQIALDDEAIFLSRWQQLILNKVLTDEAIKNKHQWQLAKTLLQVKPLHAAVDSVAYRLSHNFRINVRNEVFSQLKNQLKESNQAVNFRTIRHQIETPLWALINQQPNNFLTDEQGSWQTLLNNAFIETLADMTKEQPLSEATWGQQNTTKIRHPLSKGVPVIGNWLDMPSSQLAGDSYMPRVQGTTFGASERMVVSPGHEESGILHMPTSQSGHPWSPYYGLGHKDWELGKSSPFLPGKTQYRLVLLSY